MSARERSPYEQEMREQPEALRRFADSPLPSGLSDLAVADYPRIVLTGMGSSHFAALPLWRTLVAAGCPAWWVSTTQLLDSPHLVSAGSLVVMTSQSGRSGEVVAAVRDGRVPRPRTLIGVTNDPSSPLAAAADICLPLLSGRESTVSAKSYLNSVAAHWRIAAALVGTDPTVAVGDIVDAAADLSALDCDEIIAHLAGRTMAARAPRVAFIGKADDAATALLGGLIVKEAAKVTAEGYVGGEFRHGPLEIAGPGLTAMIFAGGSGSTTADTDPSLSALAVEVTDTGSEVVIVGGRAQPGVGHVPLQARSPLGMRVLSAKVAQVLSVELARAGGRVPGEFLFGQKITSTL